MGAIAKEYVCKGAPVLVLTVSIESDIFPENQRRRGLLCSRAEGLPFLRAVDATETDTFRVGVVQDLDRIAIEDGDDGAGEIGEGFYDRKTQENDNA